MSSGMIMNGGIMPKSKDVRKLRTYIKQNIKFQKTKKIKSHLISKSPF